jgi:hypothetical protein
MKAGDLVKFKSTGAIGTILHVYAPDSCGGFVDLLVADGTLDNTACSNGITSMSNGMLWRTAELISESR